MRSFTLSPEEGTATLEPTRPADARRCEHRILVVSSDPEPLSSLALEMLLTGQDETGLLPAGPRAGPPPSGADRRILVVHLSMAEMEATLQSVAAGNRVPLLLTSDEGSDHEPDGGERRPAYRLHLLPPREPRHAARVGVRLEASGVVLIGQTANISRSGMLVELPSGFDPGTRISFELALGQRPIRGIAEVVRRSQEEPGKAGVACQFCTFTDDSRVRLQQSLERLLGEGTGATWGSVSGR